MKKAGLIGCGASLFAIVLSWLIGWWTLQEVGFLLIMASVLVACPGAFANDESNFYGMTHPHVSGKREKRLQIAKEQSEKKVDFSMLMFSSAAIPLVLGLFALWLNGII